MSSAPVPGRVPVGSAYRSGNGCNAIVTLCNFALVAILASLCAACAHRVRPVHTAAAPTHMGFLKDYSLLKADASDPGYLRSVVPDIQPAQYHRFIVEKPDIIVNTGDEYHAVDPSHLAEITHYYVTAMTTALGRHYAVVTEPGPGTAFIRAAVVGAVEVRQPLKPRNLLPYSALFKVARVATGTDPYVLRMSMESEVLDAQTGALLGEAVDTRQGSKTILKGHRVSSGQVQQLIDFWVQRFVERLDKANGFSE